MVSLQEIIPSIKEGSITSIQVVYIPANDLTYLAPTITLAHLYATTRISCQRYPTVDPLDSTSTILQPRIVDDEHYETARVEQTL
ncbi:hypothetical protein IEQ34_012635 [Dendrobium chrysotoxum]|uniref:H(+)-transporting two-sector ATPase n=1 Tax=Dendrobium chrysotoxum TaxID=161865 RepID=A0AAV7G607_DENCH|nr:hypothetical protein IEQ34_012635 [Dendrobium chrysotoxum]